MRVLGCEEEARTFVAERCEAASLHCLERFVTRLGQANQRQNLVSRSSLGAIWMRHIADSAQLLDHVSRETSPWMDLGSGAGFPGLVLAIMRPDTAFVLVEARNLRIQWLSQTVTDLALHNCEIRGCDLGVVPNLEAGAISARAFAPLPRLVAQSARFSTAATRWVLPKGRSAAQEVAALPAPVRSMFHVKQSVTDPEAGIVVGTGQVEVIV